MKKLAALVLAMVMALTMALPVFAASGITSDEQALLDRFTAIVNEAKTKFGIEDEIANQYIGEAKNALMNVDLDKAACDDLAATMETVAAQILGYSTKAELKAAAPSIIETVNATSQKYGMTVKVDLNNTKEFAHVLDKDGNVIGSSKSAVNRTGFDATQTLAVLAVLAIAFGAGLLVANKKKLFAF